MILLLVIDSKSLDNTLMSLQSLSKVQADDGLTDVIMDSALLDDEFDAVRHASSI